jgi:hypothetical protein
MAVEIGMIFRKRRGLNQVLNSTRCGITGGALYAQGPSERSNILRQRLPEWVGEKSGCCVWCSNMERC